MIQCTCNASYARLSGFNGNDGGTVQSMHELFYRREMLDASDNLTLIGVAGSAFPKGLLFSVLWNLARKNTFHERLCEQLSLLPLKAAVHLILFLLA